jgi:hypothetical protein
VTEVARKKIDMRVVHFSLSCHQMEAPSEMITSKLTDSSAINKGPDSDVTVEYFARAKSPQHVLIPT